MQTFHQENEDYELYLEGSIHSWDVSGTSDHYYDYTHTYRQWRGSGVMTDKKTGLSFQFNFTNGQTRGEIPRSLEDVLFATNRTINGYLYGRPLTIYEVAIPGEEERIFNMICQRILALVLQCEEPIKRIRLEPTAFNDLVAVGLAPDRDGQIHLALG